MGDEFDKAQGSGSGAAPRASSLFSLKSIAILLLAGTLGAAGVAKRNEIGDALSDLLRHVTHVQFLGLQADFSAESIDRTVRSDLFARPDAPDKNRIARDAQALTDADLVRLLNVGLLNNLCDYELATTQMTRDFEADKRLRDMELVKIEEDERLKSELIQKMKLHKDKPSDIGRPKTCYQMTLTDHGHDVRTALIYAYAAAFAKSQSALAPTAQYKMMHEAQR